MVWRYNVPWYPKIELRLDGYKPSEDPQAHAGRGEDDEDPNIELDFRPEVVFWCVPAGHLLFPFPFSQYTTLFTFQSSDF